MSLSGPFSGPPSLSQEKIHGVTANPYLHLSSPWKPSKTTWFKIMDCPQWKVCQWLYGYVYWKCPQLKTFTKLITHTHTHTPTPLVFKEASIEDIPIFNAQVTFRQLRARRVLLQFKDVPLSTRRALSLYKVYGNSALLVLNGTSLICNNALLALNWRLYHTAGYLYKAFTQKLKANPAVSNYELIKRNKPINVWVNNPYPFYWQPVILFIDTPIFLYHSNFSVYKPIHFSLPHSHFSESVHC